MRFPDDIPERVWYIIAAVLAVLILVILLLIYHDAKNKKSTASGFAAPWMEMVHDLVPFDPHSL